MNNHNLVSKRGIIYCRVSSLEQVDGTSLESQERICREYAEREGIEVVAVFIDKGESAKTADRPQFLQAIAFCTEKKNHIDRFIVYKLDRFARSQDDHVAVRAKLKLHKVELRSVTEPINDSSTGRLMENILSSFAEFDNSIRTERSSNGMKERLKQGYWVWQAPLGYKRTEKGGVMIPDQNAHFIRLAFTQYAKGTHTYKSLATFLFKKGFSSKTGRMIPFQTIQKLLQNPLYAGLVQKPEWGIEVTGKHEPLVSQKLFATCQSSGRTHTPTKKRQHNPDFPLRRLITCAHCQKPLTGSYSTGRGGKKHPYYHHYCTDCPHTSSIKKTELETEFVSYLQRINPNLAFANAFREICLDLYETKQKEAVSQNRSLEQRLNALNERKVTIFDNFEEGIYTKTDFLERKRAVEREIYAVSAQKFETLPPFAEFEAKLKQYLETVTNTPDTWLKLAERPDERLRFQNFIFESTIPYEKISGLGTATLSPIYNAYQLWSTDSSSLVTLRGIEPRFPG